MYTPSNGQPRRGHGTRKPIRDVAVHTERDRKEHLLVEARGSDRYMKVSKVRDVRWQVRHCTVDLNCPWNSATMMDSLSSLCLLQAKSAAA
ncbi:hypothetical protein EYF80_021443 [Liparis tanakae]|uniref:Uncharacterized protein n=1 Tax=Liparis tanakae TaxID=230148 RepID=A0A4Z2HRX9_9TELE|nr:hypothetical protein EYF80_021443 [Liparis tanakae]